PDRSARTACLRPAPAGRAERQCRLVDPRRRSRTGLAGRRSGAVSLVEGSRPDAGVPGRLPGPRCRRRTTAMTTAALVGLVRRPCALFGDAGDDEFAGLEAAFAGHGGQFVTQWLARGRDQRT